MNAEADQAVKRHLERLATDFYGGVEELRQLGWFVILVYHWNRVFRVQKNFRAYVEENVFGGAGDCGRGEGEGEGEGGGGGGEGRIGMEDEEVEEDEGVEEVEEVGSGVRTDDGDDNSNDDNNDNHNYDHNDDDTDNEDKNKKDNERANYNDRCKQK